ncbi:hypothetical protein IAU59_006798 [Kwoniella sp. CBS 9459]
MRSLALFLLGAGALTAAKTSQDVFTPEDMLTTPRPQAAIASPDGSHAVSVVDQWDSKADKMHRSVYLLPLNTTTASHPISLLNTTSAQASSFLWLDSTTLAYLNGTSLLSFSINVTVQGHAPPSTARPTELLTFPKGVNPIGLQFESDSGVLAFNGQVWQDDGDFEHTGKLDKKWEDRGDSALVYDNLFVRHWDTWRTPGKVWTIGVTKFRRKAGMWEVAADKKEDHFINLLRSTGLYSQMDPFGSFSISPDHIAIALKTPHLSYATHTREDIYLLPLPKSFSRPHHPVNFHHLTPHKHGAISGLTFSPDGKKLAWLEQAKDGYESDRRVVNVHTFDGKTVQWTEEWDRSPSSITWSLESDSLYLLAEHHGRVLPYHLTHANHLPTPLVFNGSTSSITPLQQNKLLITQSSLTSPADDFILTLPDPKKRHVDGITGDKDGDKLPHESIKRLTAWSARHIGSRLEGLGGEEFWFQGAEGKDVMAWALKPRGWQEGEERVWPLAFLIHGGPQGAWEDAWSTRWNPAVYASQGYFVVTINPTGSTGYGQEFTDAIQGDWGGKPYKDLLAGYKHALKLFPEIDPDRTAALGASYGGYMVNWINGHNDHFGFKALVCHDGLFDTTSAYFSTEEVYFPTQDFAGTPFTNRATYEKWNPLNHAVEWTTPQLVIQGGLDYRLENSQGLGAFTALQTQGVPSRFVYFPDENHWVLQPHNSIRWHHEVLRWLHEWVGKVHGDNVTPADDSSEAIDVDGRFIVQV